jgi:hypothetical protein
MPPIDAYIEGNADGDVLLCFKICTEQSPIGIKNLLTE